MVQQDKRARRIKEKINLKKKTVYIMISKV